MKKSQNLIDLPFILALLLPILFSLFAQYHSSFVDIFIGIATNTLGYQDNSIINGIAIENITNASNHLYPYEASILILGFLIFFLMVIIMYGALLG